MFLGEKCILRVFFFSFLSTNLVFFSTNLVF